MGKISRHGVQANKLTPVDLAHKSLALSVVYTTE
jgi:hypothetical protein